MRCRMIYMLSNISPSCIVLIAKLKKVSFWCLIEVCHRGDWKVHDIYAEISKAIIFFKVFVLLITYKS